MVVVVKGGVGRGGIGVLVCVWGGGGEKEVVGKEGRCVCVCMFECVLTS